MPLFRELALQISEQFQALGRSFHVNVCTVVGGLDIMTQALELNKRPHIIVGTPGRIADLITSSNFEFKRIQFLVFDEADRLVDPKGSFMRSEIPTVLESVGNKNTHWLFFSATLTSPVLKFKQDRRIMHPMFKFSGNTEFGTSDDVRQYFLLVPSQARDAYLIFLLREFIKNSSVIVFTGKCRTCELVVETLRQLNVVALALHGKMPQRSRIASLNKFRSGASKLLITTDVGSRGLDIPQVAVVINFDLPADARDYVHRIGRTGRSSRPGTALSLVNEIDLEILKSIENSTGKLMENFPGSLEDGRILATLNEVSAAKRRASMILHDKKFGEKAEKNKNKWKK